MNKKKSNFASIFSFCLSILIGGTIGLIIPKQFSNRDMPLGLFIASNMLSIILIPLAFIIQIIIHEAGHLIFGLLTGYQFSSFRIGNLLWIKDGQRIHFKRLSVAGTAGQCLMAPPDLIYGEMPFVLYNLGGSLANLLSAILFGYGYTLFRHVPFMSIFLLLLCLIGILTAVLNSIPLRFGIIDNDGKNVLSILKSEKALQSFWIQLKLTEELCKGKRLEELPDPWFLMPTDEEMKNPITAVIGVFCANKMLDSHSFSQAAALMDNLLAKDYAVMDLHRNLLIFDRIYCKLIDLKPLEANEILLDKKQKKFMKRMKNHLSIIRTQYTIALLYENNSEKSQKLLQSFEKNAKSHPYKGVVEGEMELINIAKQVYIDKEKTMK